MPEQAAAYHTEIKLYIFTIENGQFLGGFWLFYQESYWLMHQDNGLYARAFLIKVQGSATCTQSGESYL